MSALRSTCPGSGEPVPPYLDVVECPECTEAKKMTVARRHLLTRPVEGPLPIPEGLLAPESAARPPAAWLAPSSTAPSSGWIGCLIRGRVEGVVGGAAAGGGRPRRGVEDGGVSVSSRRPSAA